MIAFRVRGRVQGVGFRSGTARLATVLGLHGWVRNVSDGTVQGRVHGPTGALEAFFARLPHASFRAEVAGIDQKPAEDEESLGFEVLASTRAPTEDWG